MIEILQTLPGEKERRMLAELISAEDLQHEINLNPERMAVALKGFWRDLSKDPKYSGVKFPKDLEDEVDLLSTLDKVGL
jgi:hypothetical protein